MAKRGKSSGGGEVALTMDVDRSALDRVAQELPRALDGEVADALRQLGDQATADMQRAVRSIPSHHGGRTRNDVARGIKFVARGGRLVLSSDSSAMEAGRQAMPACLNSASWVHPVFGRRDKVTQRGRRYWDPAKYEDEARRLLEKAADAAAGKVDR